jgi:ATP-binding cassette subfamily B protein
LKFTSPFYKKTDAKDYGPTCLRINSKHYGKLISPQEIWEYSETTHSGSNLFKLSEAAESIGFKIIGAKLDFNRLKQAQLPLIVHWDKRHFVVVYRIKKDQVYLSDPAQCMLLRNGELWMLEKSDEELEKDYFRLFRVGLKVVE